MPIECRFKVQPLDQDAFHAIDKMVMRHAFDIHNEMGRFLDERIYQDELAFRCIESGIVILREPMIRVTHGDFTKDYFLDMLTNLGVIYELKTIKALGGSHESQLINYLLLAGLNHGKLINMRPVSVESRYVSTRLTESKRHHYSFNMAGWNRSAPGAAMLHDTLTRLLDDWGAFLDVLLYREALIHFLGGENLVVKPIDICVGTRVVGKQKVSMAGEDSAFHISAIKDFYTTYEKHLVRLLEHSQLRYIHWINFQGDTIQLKTLERK
jgi:GxxExxY protein